MAASFHGSLPTYLFPSPGGGVLSKFVSATDAEDMGANVVRVIFSRSRLERERASSVIETEVTSEECQR